MQIAQGGLPWIITTFLCFIFFGILTIMLDGRVHFLFVIISGIFGLLSLLFLIFFRDPQRAIGPGIVAVADGIIREFNEIRDSDIGDAWFISTFMNIYHVHVNRMPIDGTIKKIEYHSGSHLPAFTKESNRNERMSILVDTKHGPFKIVLIAGTLARRIVPYIKKGDVLKKGEKISLIRLGSRVDIYIPKKMNISLCITKKERVKAGGTTLATSNV
jgi:phosphatidylserine decarboxylase